ncbi:acyl-CoA N-acyltransferase [Amylocarpus encephaloides]|uniref:Glucosamine 6-phosphate N-acetyltransferase n=1 Tax=Amylocarpus encephaloides TaxID=45428 RepID=A0A9P7YM49_9HELO|nr:acyl-CoA N-acyltransferase [Amylocarpus encephaloides]
MAATPFISIQRPSNLDGYNRNLSYAEQPTNIPKTFLDAMEVREEVFVREQSVPLHNEFDSDDARAVHWVIYASINTMTEAQKTDDKGNILQRQKSVTTTQPIGTIRLVPFPHPPHPEPGSSYAADALETNPDADPSDPPFIVDRATTFHDGKEPYVKLGRIAVLKEFRRSGISKILVNAAMAWARENPAFFNPSIATMGMDKMGASGTDEIPIWKGLVCVHAQVQVIKVWGKWGFELDEGMGTWFEEGIEHVGMFQRMDISLTAKV